MVSLGDDLVPAAGDEGHVGAEGDGAAAEVVAEFDVAVGMGEEFESMRGTE